MNLVGGRRVLWAGGLAAGLSSGVVLGQSSIALAVGIAVGAAGAKVLGSNTTTAAVARSGRDVSLLADLLQADEQARHQAAAEHHAMAAAAYVAAAAEGVAGPVCGTSPAQRVCRRAARRELAAHVEQLREQMAATRPSAGPGDTSTRMMVHIAAYVASVRADRLRPTLVVEIDDDLAVNWSAETSLLAMLRELLREPAGDPSVGLIRVTAGIDGDDVVLAVEHDHGDGQLTGRIHVGRVGDGETAAGPIRPKLRLVSSDAGSSDCTSCG